MKASNLVAATLSALRLGSLSRKKGRPVQQIQSPRTYDTPATDARKAQKAKTRKPKRPSWVKSITAGPSKREMKAANRKHMQKESRRRNRGQK